MTDTKQPEALRLADLLDGDAAAHHEDAAAELRRLHKVNQELLEELVRYADELFNLRKELAKPEQAEKQEHQFKYTPYGLRADELGNLSIGELPRKEWVGLTDKEILDLWVANHKNTGATDAFACAVEAKLKDKNYD